MNYQTFKIAKQKAVDAFLLHDIFFAFDKQQFEEGVKKVHAKKTRRGKYLLSKISPGGYINNSAIESFKQFFKNWKQRERALKNNEKFIITGLIYEYRNNEAQFGGIGRANAEENFPQATEEHKRRAWRIFWRDCVRNDRF